MLEIRALYLTDILFISNRDFVNLISLEILSTFYI